MKYREENRSVPSFSQQKDGNPADKPGVQFQHRTRVSVLGLKLFHHAYIANNFLANIWNAIRCNTLSDVFRNLASVKRERLFGCLNNSRVRLSIF